MIRLSSFRNPTKRISLLPCTDWPWMRRPSHRLGTSVLQAEFVAQDLAAMGFADGGLARGHGLGKCFTQIEIAADTFLIDTIQAEHRFGMLRVDRVFDLPVLSDTFRRKVCKFHRQRPQFRKLL